MTIADKLRSILTVKDQIKAAIAAKGVAITNATPFSDYPTKIQSIVGVDVSKGQVEFLTNATGVYFTKIILPIVTTVIQNSAYASQINLKEVVINEGCQTIGSNAFQYCSILDTINLPSTLNTLGTGALANTKIKNITLDYNITAFGSGVFSGCTSLERAILNFNNTFVPSNSFTNCTKLTSVTLAPKIKQISPYAFSNCSVLADINLENITTLEGYSFNNCSALTTVNLPALTSLLSNYIFVNMNSLEFIDFGKLSTFVISTIQNAPKLKSLIFREESITFVDSGFSGMTGLKYLEFKRVEQIYLLANAFGGLSSLEAVVIRCPTPTPLSSSANPPFNGIPSTCKIYVPDASLNAYKTANAWLKLATYFRPMSEFVMPVL